jgi:hypothetical protein
MRCVTNGIVCHEFITILLRDQAPGSSATLTRVIARKNCGSYIDYEIFESYVVINCVGVVREKLCETIWKRV